jgi:histone-lysine N-methyltransferase SETMAR
MKRTILLSEKSSNLINPIQNKAKQMNKKNLIGNKRKLSSSSILQKTSSTKKRIKYIDISNGNENTKILLNSKDKSKMLKNFQFTTNYTTESIIINKYQKSYLNEGNILDKYKLPKTYCCNCNESCKKETCNCINKHNQIYECNSNCLCKICSNRIIQKGISHSLIIKYINKSKGFGLFANDNISKGDFICEYIGEIISKEEAEKKIYMNHILKKPNYILQIRECYSNNFSLNTFIDSEKYGNCARFINHSCQPNLTYEFVRIEHFIPHCAFYANKDIKKGEELTFCYSSYINNNNNTLHNENKSFSYKKCECGSSLCCGFIPN